MAEAEQEDDIETRFCSANVCWEDSFSLLKLMQMEGKAWSKILEILKNHQHCFTSWTPAQLSHVVYL